MPILQCNIGKQPQRPVHGRQRKRDHGIIRCTIDPSPSTATSFETFHSPRSVSTVYQHPHTQHRRCDTTSSERLRATINF